LPGARIRQPGNGFCLVNSGDCYAKLRQCLPEFQANDAKAHHGDRFRQVFLFKQGVAGKNPIAKVHPRRRHHRAGPARDDDVLSLDDVIADLQPAGLNEARIAIEKLLFHLVCAVPQHPIYQNVAKVPNMFKDVWQVGGQSFPALDTFAIEQLPAMQVMPYLDQRFRGHAPYPRAGRPKLTAINQHKRLICLPNLADGSETRCPGADDGNINTSLHQSDP